MELVFNAKRIAEIEREQRVPFQDLLAKFSISTLVIFVQKGIGAKTEDEAFEAIDKFMETDNAVELYFQVIEALQRADFLPKALNVNEMREMLNSELTKSVTVSK